MTPSPLATYETFFRGEAVAGAHEAPPQQFSVRKPTSPFMASKLAE
jgi:hypothetical protein